MDDDRVLQHSKAIFDLFFNYIQENNLKPDETFLIMSTIVHLHAAMTDDPREAFSFFVKHLQDIEQTDVLEKFERLIEETYDVEQ
jgi:hypothetical protein